MVIVDGIAYCISDILWDKLNQNYMVTMFDRTGKVYMSNMTKDETWYVTRKDLVGWPDGPWPHA